jgi:hypothetical protein
LIPRKVACQKKVAGQEIDMNEILGLARDRPAISIRRDKPRLPWPALSWGALFTLFVAMNANSKRLALHPNECMPG